jgi:hypothetical protein
MKMILSTASLRWVKLTLVVLSAALMLSACFEEEMDSVSYQGANHTNIAAMYVTINGEGGIMIAMEHGYGGNVCCVNVPKKWRPGLTVTVGWQDEGHFLRDKNGNEVLRDGNNILVSAPRKTKTVAIPEYATPEILWIHFFPNDEIKLVMSKYGPGHPKHGLPDPEAEKFASRALAEQKAAEKENLKNATKP